MSRRIAVVGGGISGLGAAWALHQHPDRFDFRLFEARDQLGGNAVTVEMPQDNGSSVPFDISVTACIPSVYHHIVLLMERFGIELVDTRFSYSVRYRGDVYAHDFDSDIRRQLHPEIEKFQRILRRLHRFGRLSRSRSKLVNALNPFNYVSMGTVLNLGGFSGDFRYKILKPMFVNFLMATNVFDMPAALFSRYLEFFDIEVATPMQTWDQGTRRIYEHLSADFKDKIYLNRPVRKVYRQASGVVIEDEHGVKETFDDVILACNANQTLMILDKPCLVTYNPISRIDEKKIIGRWWFQHIVHDVRQATLLIYLFRFIQGKRKTWHCGAHTLINSQETCFVSGLAAAAQMGADYPFDDPEAKRSFNHYGSLMHGWRFKKAKA